jgi:uncharacterized membrane protein
MVDRFGGPVGRHTEPRGHWWWTPLRVVLATVTVVLALGLVQKAPCVQTGWTDNDVRYQAMCYSDIPYLYTARGFAEQHWPYSASDRYPAMEYPVGISYLAWIAGELTALNPRGPSEAVRADTSPEALFTLPGMQAEVNENFLITVLLLAGLGMVAAAFLAGAHPRRPYDALGFALSPALLLTAYVNWDLLAVACVAGALWSWSRGRPWLTGLFIGLGTASKLYPLFLLGGCVVLAFRPGAGARERWRAAGAVALAALGSWVVAQVPAWLGGDWSTWTNFWTFNSDRGADLGSLWLVASHLGHDSSAHVINLVSWLAFAAECVGVLLIGRRSPARPRLAQLGFLVVAAFLVVNKVYSPQYVLWLLPLAALARPRWRDLLIWQATEVAYFAAVWMYLHGDLKDAGGTGQPAYDIAIVVRVLGELYLAGRIIWDLWHPEDDPVAVTSTAPPQPPLISTRSNSVVV